MRLRQYKLLNELQLNIVMEQRNDDCSIEKHNKLLNELQLNIVMEQRNDDCSIEKHSLFGGSTI